MSGFDLSIVSFGIVLSSTLAWALMIYKFTIPNNRIAFIVAWLLGWGTGVAALILGTGSLLANIGLGFALIVSSFLLLTVLIGGQKGGTGQFVVGSPVPALSAPDENGEIFDMASMSGKPILLKFFRGHW
jgi:hypothetical protein